MLRSGKKFEILIAVLGITITALLGYGQYRLGVNQLEAQKKSTVDMIEMQAMSMVGPYLGDLGNDNEDGKAAERVVSETVEYLSNRYGRTSLAKLAEGLIEKSKTVTETTKVKIYEATRADVRQMDQPQESKYFAVLASYPLNKLETAKQAANRKLDQVKASGFQETVELWQTQISRHYAVVVGGPMSQKKAMELVKTARSEDWADDAFWQVDKNWSHVGKAPFIL